MKQKVLVVGFAVCLAMLSSVSQASAQPTRIKFPRGAVTTNVRGTMTSFSDLRVYKIRVRSGQTLRAEQIAGRAHPVTISFIGPDGRAAGDSDASCNGRRETFPTLAGDYVITVVECRKAWQWRGRFTFRVTVR